MFANVLPMASNMTWIWPPSRSLVAGGATAIRHMHQRCAGTGDEKLASEVLHGAETRRRIRHLARMRLGVRHQAPQASHRQCRVDDHDLTARFDCPDRCKIAERVIGERFVERRCRRHGGRRRHQQGVAIGRSLGDEVGPDGCRRRRSCSRPAPAAPTPSPAGRQRDGRSHRLVSPRGTD